MPRMDYMADILANHHKNAVAINAEILVKCDPATHNQAGHIIYYEHFNDVLPASRDNGRHAVAFIDTHNNLCWTHDIPQVEPNKG